MSCAHSIRAAFPNACCWDVNSCGNKKVSAPNSSISFRGWCNPAVVSNTALGNGAKKPNLQNDSIGALHPLLAGKTQSPFRVQAGSPRSRRGSLFRAVSQESEEPPDDGDYSLPPLDFQELLGEKARAKKEKQQKNDATLLESWDDSPLSKESTYDKLESTYEKLGARGGQTMAREFTGEWRAVDPTELLTKWGIQDPKAEELAKRFAAQQEASEWSEPMRKRQVAGREGAGQKRRGPGAGTRRRPEGDRKKGLSGRVSDNQGPPASVSGRGEAALKSPEKRKESGQQVPSRGLQTWQELQTRPSERVADGGTMLEEPLLETKPSMGSFSQEQKSTVGSVGGGNDGRTSPPPGKNAPSFDQWDLGLPDYDLVKEYTKQAPSAPRGGQEESDILTPLVMPEGGFGSEGGPSFAASYSELGVENGGGNSGELGALAMPPEELAAKARAIEARFRSGSGGVFESGQLGNPNGLAIGQSGRLDTGESGAKGGGLGSGVETPPAVEKDLGSAADVDDDSLLAQFDQMMATKDQWMPTDVHSSELGGLERGQKGGGGKGKKGPRGLDEEEVDYEAEEALRRADDLLMGKSDVGLVPAARARLEEERRLESAAVNAEEETDDEEEIEEQFIQDPDWQDGWGDDMYLDIDGEVEKAKEVHAAKEAKQGKRDIIDLTRGNEPLAGKLNRDGTLSIEGSLEGRGAGKAVRGIEQLSRRTGENSRKPVDVESARRESEEFVAALRLRAEERKKGGAKKRAVPDTGSLWETPEMVADRRKAMAHDTLEEELEEEEKLLEQRGERVAREYSLIDSVVSGSFDDEDLEAEALENEVFLEELEEELSLDEESAGSALLDQETGVSRRVDFKSVLDKRQLGKDGAQERNQDEERESQRRRAEESLRMGGFWADLDDEPVSDSARTARIAASRSSRPQALSPERNDVPTRTGDEGRRASSGFDKDFSAVGSETQTKSPLGGNENSEAQAKNGRSNASEQPLDGPESSPQALELYSDPSLRVEVSGDVETSGGSFAGMVEAPGTQSLLEQLRPPRLRRREEPKEETVETVIDGYPELEFSEEVDRETGVVRQVIRHVGLPPGEIAAEERREAARLAQSLTIESEEVSEANRIVERLLVAGEQVEDMISQLGREKRLDTEVLRAIDRKMGIAKANKADKACETLDILYRYIEAEMERQNASPALRLLDELLRLDDGTLDEATWLRLCRDRMRQEFVPESSIDIFNPPGVPKPRADGTWEYPEDEGILRIDFVREVDDLLEDLAQQEREFARSSGFSAEAIAARLVLEQRMRTAAQLRKLKRNAAMVEV